MGIRDFIFTLNDDEPIQPVSPPKQVSKSTAINVKEEDGIQSDFVFSNQDIPIEQIRESVIYQKGAVATWDFQFKGKGSVVDGEFSLEDIAKDIAEGTADDTADDTGNYSEDDNQEDGADNAGEDNEDTQDSQDSEDSQDNVDSQENPVSDEEQNSEDEGQDQISEMKLKEVSDDEDEEEDKVMDLKKKAFFADDSSKERSLYESFTEMNISRALIKGLTDMGFMTPTRIQAMAIPVALGGRDLCAAASTGSGKSAAFLVPILERLYHGPRKNMALTRVLIVLPTRELAAQCYSVATKMAKYMEISFCLCVGGMASSHQEAELVKRPDVVIATPGRLIDHVRNSKGFDLNNVEILILDEADRMLEEGFQAELTEIIKACPKQRQTLLFSATMTDNVDKLIQLSLNRPIRLFIDSNQQVAPTLVQEFIRVRPPSNSIVETQKKLNEEDPSIVRQRESILLALCSRHYKSNPTTRTIIFFPSKTLTHRMKLVFTHFNIPCLELHGSLNQQDRLQALASFSKTSSQTSSFFPFLLCTDLASRGLDLPGVDWVINYSMPSSYDRYIHRVGRTARYGRYGLSTSLCAEKDRKLVKNVMKNLRDGVKLRQRVVGKSLIQKWANKLENIQDTITAKIKDEKLDKEMDEAERGITKAENILKHSESIKSRPQRTWFQTEKEKKLAKAIGKPSNNDDEKQKENLTPYEQELQNELSKPLKRGKFAGLSRKTKRRKMAREEESFDKSQHRQIVSAKRVKKLNRQNKI